MSYAETTTVAFEKSIAEIITLIKRHNAMQIGQFEGEDFFAIQFTMSDRTIRFRLPVPALAAMPTHDGRRNALQPSQRHEKLAQARRSRGRALLLVIKAKLESVESKIETVEEAFLSNIVMADGATLYERVAGPIALEYETGRVAAVAGFLTGPAQPGEGA